MHTVASQNVAPKNIAARDPVRSHLRLALALGCALVCVGLAVRPADADDRVYPVQGSLVSGDLQKITPAQVTITVRNEPKNYQLSDVRKITFDDEPKELDRAREQVLLGQFDQALDEVNKIELSSIQNPLIRQDIEFYRAYCEGKLGLAGAGDKKKAYDGLMALVRANSQTHHFYPICEMLGELAAAAGQNAKPFYEKLLEAPSPETIAMGVYRLGEVELAAGNTAAAKTRFDQLATAQSTSPAMTRLKNLAEVGLAVCKLQADDPQAALDQLNSMVKTGDSTDQELFARISNAKGACFLAMKQPDRAILSYLHTDLLFFTEADAHAEALYQLSKLWPGAGQAARAADAKARLTQRYASSTWANKP
ncbi:tetratricopeptide repeat protein [Aureliella helgolandensis]|uniref:Tetratricopeptide repeat protein n=1 Tax=Aureliella helgolandensis TaxID=2527968 RepID=A0A518GF53_9BACT|nr:hypothetical protein [Aureliella helgolandensis]QDV27232.1 hypothetical protein Q31a_56200 [Aureliella helgolandensis]